MSTAQAVYTDTHGIFEAKIFSSFQEANTRQSPSLKITAVTGPGPFDFTDIHTSQAKTVKELRKRWELMKSRMSPSGINKKNEPIWNQ